MTEVRCPMPECRKRIDLGVIPPVPHVPEREPCFHYIAAWGPGHGGMAEAILWGLHGNREFLIRNLRVPEVTRERIEETRADLEAAARRFAHEVSAHPEPVQGGADEASAEGALFGDQHERNHVAFACAQIILGPDPTLPPSAR